MSADAPKGVIFDCDGTLVDSEPLSARAWKAALLPYGYEVTDEDLRQCIGRSYTHTHAFFAARAPIPDRAALWVRLCAEMFPLIDAELKPFADAVATVEVLRAAGVPLAVASSSARERLDRTLAAAGMAAWFDVTVAGDEIARGKPEPDIFLLAAQRLEIEPQACVVVEDSAAGVAAAARAGMATVAVVRDGSDRAALGQAHVVVETLSPQALAEAGRVGDRC